MKISSVRDQDYTAKDLAIIAVFMQELPAFLAKTFDVPLSDIYALSYNGRLPYESFGGIMYRVGKYTIVVEMNSRNKWLIRHFTRASVALKLLYTRSYYDRYREEDVRDEVAIQHILRSKRSLERNAKSLLAFHMWHTRVTNLPIPTYIKSPV